MKTFIYMHDGTFDGLLTCIFDAYVTGETPANIIAAGDLALALDQEIKQILTSPAKAARVQNGIIHTLGEEAAENVFTASLSTDPDTGKAIFNFLQLGFRVGRSANSMLSDPSVWKLHAICRLVRREQHAFTEFLRFGELTGGVYLSEFKPNANILPLIMPHFAGRFNDCAFVIHDKGRRMAGVYDKSGWYLTSTERMTLPAFTQGERDMRALWKLFFQSITIKERVKPTRQRNVMPIKYRKYMTEFID